MAIVDIQQDVVFRQGSTMLTAEGSQSRYWGDVYIESGSNLLSSGHHSFEGNLQSLGGLQTLNFTGDISLDYSNVFWAQLSTDSQDQLFVEVNLQFNGMLVLSTLAGFVGEAGDTFQIFDWGSGEPSPSPSRSPSGLPRGEPGRWAALSRGTSELTRPDHQLLRLYQER